MKNKNILWLYLFLFAGILDIIFTANEEYSSRIFTKPLILIALWGFFIFSTKEIKGSILRKSMSAALIFSWLGDVLLMFPDLFLYGLGAFLMAHISYIIGFKIAQTNPFAIGKVNFIHLFFVNLPIYIFAALVYFLINPGLGPMKVPVVIYLIVIVMMVTTARERFKKTNAISFWQVLIGGIFFMISDGVLAINMFYKQFPESGVIVMGTYIIAQFLIVRGILAHLDNSTFSNAKQI
jgi:uncharacterized membrane protein YhhN